MYEHRLNGWHHEIKLSCDCIFKWYHDVHTGIRMIYPSPSSEERYINGMTHPINVNTGKNTIDPGIQALSDSDAPIFKIRCPTHKTIGDYTFKLIVYRKMDINESELNPYDKLLAHCLFRDDD